MAKFADSVFNALESLRKLLLDMGFKYRTINDKKLAKFSELVMDT